MGIALLAGAALLFFALGEGKGGGGAASSETFTETVETPLARSVKVKTLQGKADAEVEPNPQGLLSEGVTLWDVTVTGKPGSTVKVSWYSSDIPGQDTLVDEELFDV